MKPEGVRLLRWLAIAALAALIGFGGVSAYFAIKLTGPVRKPIGSFTAYLPVDTQTVEFKARDGITLRGWFAPVKGATTAVVLLHGHGSTRRQMLARAKLLHDHGYAVLLYDARGHGISDGDHVSMGYKEVYDLLGSLDFLRMHRLQTFGLIGVSQGGATIALAGDQLKGQDVRWAVIESTYPTLRDAVDRRFRNTFDIPGWLAACLMIPMAEYRLGVSIDAIAPINRIGGLPCPLFVLHGSKDVHTLPQAALDLASRSSPTSSLWVVPGAAHVDLYGFAKDEYATRLLQFIRSGHPANSSSDLLPIPRRAQ